MDFKKPYTTDEVENKWISNKGRVSENSTYHIFKDCHLLPDDESNIVHPTKSQLEYHELRLCSGCEYRLRSENE